MQPINNYNNIVTSNEINFANKNSTHNKLTLDLAARQIQLFFRKIIAAKAYKHMFDNGSYFKQYKEIPSPPKSLNDYLEIAQKLSTKAINEIKDNLGDLNQQEKAFVIRIMQLPNFTLRHQTPYNLDYTNKREKATLTINSHYYLQQHNYNCKNKTSIKDIKSLSNNDFIFFSIDFSGSDLSAKPESSIVGDNEDYGYQAYLTNLPNKDFGYLTLTDHFYNTIARSPDRCSFSAKYPKLRRNIFTTYCGKLGLTDIPIFTKKDMRRGLAYYCIQLLRKANCANLNKFVYQDSTLKDINKILNIIFSPEYHVPRIFSTTDFKLHQLREPSVEEIYKITSFYNQPDIIRQYYLSEYSTSNELININNYQARSILSEAASKFVNFAETAIKNGNADILAFCLDWIKKIKNTNYINGALFISENINNELCLSILQHNIEQMSIIMRKTYLDFSLYYKLSEILLKSQDFNYEISLLLDYYLYKNTNTCKLSTEETVNLFILSAKIDYIPECLIRKISYEDISTFFFERYILNEEYEYYHLDYAKIISQAIIMNNYDFNKFADRLHLYVFRYIIEENTTIPEDSFLGALNNPKISIQVKEILQHAFIISGLLTPNKKLNLYSEMTLKDYAKKYYNICL